MIKKCHYDVILWVGFGSTKCDPNLTSHLRRFFAGLKLDRATSMLSVGAGKGELFVPHRF